MITSLLFFDTTESESRIFSDNDWLSSNNDCKSFWYDSISENVFAITDSFFNMISSDDFLFCFILFFWISILSLYNSILYLQSCIDYFNTESLSLTIQFILEKIWISNKSSITDLLSAAVNCIKGVYLAEPRITTWVNDL